MSNPNPTCYEIRVDGQLSAHWSEWFDGLLIQAEAGGQTLLSGALPDQSALLGVLAKIHAMNLPLISVVRLVGIHGPDFTEVGPVWDRSADRIDRLVPDD